MGCALHVRAHMITAIEPQTPWARLIPWLLVCPAMLLLIVAIAPRFTLLYGTVGERVLYASMLVLPFAGVAGIARFTRAASWVKWLAALSYLAVAVLLVFLSAVFVGCSIAGACF